ncbi:MAG: cysteine desulfurase family protein [Clostridia bacterium]|nr:cysteine desulfurase family protein [Clostridia bacterium]
MIYLDNAATTLPDEKAVKTALELNEKSFFNPSALYHGGIASANEIKQAKNSLLNVLGLSSTDYEVIFTSGGTESDNMAIFGVNAHGTFITDEGEHAAVYNSFKTLKQDGRDVVFCKLNEYGGVNVNDLIDKIKTFKPSFVSIMHVNNETGAINDVSLIADEIKKIDRKIIFHSDGVQAFGKIPFNFSKNIDMYSISAHKINGLKGVGALIKRKNLSIKPIIIGGGQENGLRSGTENLFGIKVLEICAQNKYSQIKANYEKIQNVRQIFFDGLNKDIFTIISGVNSSPYVLSVATPGLRGETVMHCLENKDIIVGNGSACSSKARISRVISACGKDKAISEGVIRISFSSNTTKDEAIEAVNIINETVYDLKRMMSK